MINLKKLETGVRTNSVGIPYTLLSRIEAIWFPTFGLLPYDTYDSDGKAFGPLGLPERR